MSPIETSSVSGRCAQMNVTADQIRLKRDGALAAPSVAWASTAAKIALFIKFDSAVPGRGPEQIIDESHPATIQWGGGQSTREKGGQKRENGGGGTRTVAETKRKTAGSPKSGAKSGAPDAPAAFLADADPAVNDPALARLLAAWERLSDAEREQIVR